MVIITLLKEGSLRANNDDQELQKTLDKLIPLDYIMSWFSERINHTGINNRILVLKSDTGSGKSTAFPPNLYKTFYKQGQGNIAVTQPRVLNAINIVRDQIVGSGFYPYMKLGENIGWQTGPSKKKAKQGLIYMTLGVLIKQLKTFTDEQLMANYRFIIIDEVHEASMDQALVLCMLRNFCERNANNPKLPFIVLTSATLNVDLFLRYFKIYNAPLQPNLIQVAGFAFGLEERWTFEKTTSDYLESAFLTAKKIHIDNPNDAATRDILIFLPGKNEMEEVAQKLLKLQVELAESHKPLFLVLQLDSETVKKGGQDFSDLAADITTLRWMWHGKAKEVFRRIILSTNVAETGITIDTLKYVIDSGFHRGPEYNPHHRVSGIVTKPSQQSRIRQRKGRANRKAEGVFYPLYPKYVYENLPKQQLAEIETSDISEYALGIFVEQSKQNGSIKFDVDLLNPIPTDIAKELFERLYGLGFISPISDHKYISAKSQGRYANYNQIKDICEQSNAVATPNITKLGAIAALFGDIRIELSRMILAAYAWKCSPLDIITIAAYNSLDMADFATKKPIDWITIYRIAFHNSDPSSHKFIKKIEQKSAQIPMEDSKSYYIYRLMIADDFIDGLILFKAISRVIDEAYNGYAEQLGKPLHARTKVSVVDRITDWCNEVNIKKDGIIAFIKKRDEIIESVITTGLIVDLLDTTYSSVGPKLFSQDSFGKSFINNVTKLKYCIYEGYRLNIATLNDLGDYVTTTGIIIDTPKILRDDELLREKQKRCGITGHISESPKPKYIIYDSLKFKLDKKTQLFKVKANRISVLDGYVKNDLEFF